MPIFFRLPGASDARMRLITALLIVYIVWGTTYHALNIAMQTMPPLLMNGTRFLVAGAVMLGIARWQRLPWPSAAQWWHSALIGALMVCGAMGMVVMAQKMGIGSGLMATVVTTMPMWLALWTRWGGERVPFTSWIGLALGVLGAAVLAREGDFSATGLGALLAFGAPLCWSIGSYASRKLDLPAPAMASAAQWLLGGLMGTAVAWWLEPAAHSWSPAQMSGSAALAWLYLVVMGTLVTLNAYLWLLKNASPALAGSYSFVNPVVALWVGVALGGEVLTGQVFIALPLILLALACIIYGQPLWRWLQARLHLSDLRRA
jgi:drug/metabolite transporter (DMT)-like permease